MLSRIERPTNDSPKYLRRFQHRQHCAMSNTPSHANKASPGGQNSRTRSRLTPQQSAKAIELYEQKARALLDAYQLGTPDALERHYAFTWHRRTWEAMRSYIQLDLGKRPANHGDHVEITLGDARYLIAIEHGYQDWNELVNAVSRIAQWRSNGR